jgi:hypothetical protein
MTLPNLSYQLRWQQLRYMYYHPRTLVILKTLFVLAALCLSLHAFADGKDLAAGAADDLIATEKGTGLKIAYAIELMVALGAAIFRRSIGAFLWIFGIAAFATFVAQHFLS